MEFAYQVNPYFLNSIDMCSTTELTKTDIYIQKEHKKILFFLWKSLVIFLVFTEEIVFKQFLFINITKFRLFLFFSDTQTWKSENSKFFKDYDAYLKSDSHLPKKNLLICFIESPLKIMKNVFISS